MAYDFPASPSVNQTFTPPDGPTWRWNGSAWLLLGGIEPGGGGTGELTLVSAIDPPADPSIDGTLWYDPSTGDLSVWYQGSWYPEGTVAPSSPTPVEGLEATVSVGPVAILVKELDLPVPYFDGGNSYWSQFYYANLAGWSSPNHFVFGVFLSPSQSYYGPNTAAAGVNLFVALEGNDGNIMHAIENDIAMILQNHREWTMDRIDAENGDDSPLCMGWMLHDEPDLFSSLSEIIAEKAVYNSYDGGKRFCWVNVSHGLTGDPLFQPAATPFMVRVGDCSSADEYAYSGRGVREILIASPNWPKDDTDPEEARRAATYGWLASRLKTCQDPDNPKPYWTFIETGRPLLGVSFSDYPYIILPEISGATWSIIRNEARGICFFQHSDHPSTSFYSLTEGVATVTRGHVAALTAEVNGFAPVIDGPTYEWDFGDENIETLLKAYQGYGYIFAGPSLYAPFPGRGASDITMLGAALQFQFTNTAETGTVSSTITVPPYTELVVVMVSGLHGTNNGFASMTFTKGGIDTAMTKATGGDASGASWQSAVFYLALPDVGTNKSLKWDWLGAASDGPRTIAVTFWQGIDLNNPVRDSASLQTTGFALETPILVETSTLEIANGDKVLAFCGMYNPEEDGTATVNVWHHMVKLSLSGIGDDTGDLTAEDYAQGSLAVGTPDGDCTVGFTNISKATEVAFIAIVLKKATLEEVTTTIEQTGDIVQTTGAGSNTGIYFGTITVPADCDFVLAGVVGAASAESLTSITMLKGAVQTPMVRLECADAVDGWQAALFYMVEPDIGAGTMEWDWAGTDPIATGTQLSVLFLKGVDLADPVRQSGATQSTTIPVRTPVLSNREGDLVVTYVGMYTGSLNGSIDTWLNATLLENPDNNGFFDCAWATTSVIGSVRIGAETATNYGAGGICSVALKPAAAVTPITPAADPPTTPRTVVTGTFTLPPDLEAATEVEVVNESRTIPIVAGVFEDDFDEEYSYHNYKILIGEPEEGPPPDPPGEGELFLPLVPWHGGPAYWEQFDKADAAGWSDPDFFPFGLFLSPPQEDHPTVAAAAGITHYMSIEGNLPLSNLTDAGVHAWPHTGEWAPNGEDSRLDANSETDPLVVAWFTSDEIDMLGETEATILALSQAQVAEARGWDDGTFVGLNIGNGVNRTWWSPNIVDDLVQDVDIACCDQYAYTSGQVRENMAFSDYWPSGVSEAEGQCAGAYGWLADQMADLQDPDDRKPYGVTVETAMPYLFPYPDPEFRTITIPEIGGAVWAAIIHGASMIMFFQHNNDPAIDNYSITGSTGTAAIQAGLAALTAEVRSVASIINTQSYVFAFGASGIDTMLKAVDGYAYIFAGVGLGGSPGAKTFTMTGSGINGTSVEVVGESRSLTVSAGVFSDSFAAEYTHHIYKIAIAA